MKEMSPKDIHMDTCETWGDIGTCSFLLHSFKDWCAEFRRGRLSTNDATRSERPPVAASQENCDKVLEIIMKERRVTTRYLCAQLSGYQLWLNAKHPDQNWPQQSFLQMGSKDVDNATATQEKGHLN
eukprot:scpid29558/ scgid27261/ 